MRSEWLIDIIGIRILHKSSSDFAFIGPRIISRTVPPRGDERMSGQEHAIKRSPTKVVGTQVSISWVQLFVACPPRHQKLCGQQVDSFPFLVDHRATDGNDALIRFGARGCYLNNFTVKSVAGTCGL